MIAEIIAVGTELLMGQIVNTNARFLSESLSEIGVMVYNHTVVGDNFDRIKSALEIALSRADIVIFTGGLGPTDDDLTKEAVSNHLGLELELDESVCQLLLKYFQNRPMPECNFKQALLPKGCVVLRNPNGTAPGCFIAHGDKKIILLPGPPSELSPMFTNECVPLLKSDDNPLFSDVVHLFGIGESAVMDKIGRLFDCKQPTVAPYVKDGIVTLRVTANAKTRQDAQPVLDAMTAEIKKDLGEFVFHVGKETDLGQFVCGKLLEKRVTLSTVESCTGGMLASEITSFSGISSCYSGGFITYSNSQKVDLGVSPATLEKFGAVSEQTAVEMASCCRQRCNTQFAISTTGIAGPDGGSDQKPVGTVFVGLSSVNRTQAFKFNISGNRARARRLTVLNALHLLLKELNEKQ